MNCLERTGSAIRLGAAEQRVGRCVCLMGNLNPVEVLWRGTPEEVATAARQAIADAGQDGGLILGSGCEVPVPAPQEDLHAMIAAAREGRGGVGSRRSVRP